MSVIEDAHTAQTEQTALTDTNMIYQNSLTNYIRAKYEQVGRIEDLLENDIENQHSLLQETMMHQPGRFALPSTKKSWEKLKSFQKARLDSLRYRLEYVREIKESMGINSPRLEELAERKLRFFEPELAAETDRFRELALRNHIMQQNIKKKELHKGKSNSRGGHSNSIGVPY